MATPTHYELLGVRPTATTEEIRRAYIAAARRAHPDVTGAGSDERMLSVNAAWNTLSDPVSRERYDLSLPAPSTQSSTSQSPTSQSSTSARSQTAHSHSTHSATPPPIINNPARPAFVPRFADDEDDDDSWRYEPDPVDEATALGRAGQLLPVVALGLGFLLALVGTVVAAKPLVAVGIAVILAGAIGFVVLPIVAMGKAQSNERPESRR